MHTARFSQFQCMLGSHPPLPSACWEANPVYVGKPTPPLPNACWETPLPSACWETPLPSACWEATTPLWTEWHTGVKTLPCPKLHLHAVKYLQTQPVITIQGKKHHLTFHTQTFNCSVIAQNLLSFTEVVDDKEPLFLDIVWATAYLWPFRKCRLSWAMITRH